MAVNYHLALNFAIPNTWIKDEHFVPCSVDEQNKPWVEGIDQGVRYRCIRKYEESYPVLLRVARVALGIILFLPAYIFSYKKEVVQDLLFNSIKNIHVIRVEDFPIEKIVDVCIPMAGNPAHMGHMHMIGLAVHRLALEGYRVGKVRVKLSDEEYLKNKVLYSNESTKIHNQDPNEKSEMLRVFIPREKRVEFLREAIREAKMAKVFDQDLDVDCEDSGLVDPGIFRLNSGKIFYVWGADLVEDMCNFGGEEGDFKHAVIVTREGKAPLGVSEAHTDNYSRLIVDNPDLATSRYSSSKIQNGAYELLPQNVRKEFEKMHEAVQCEGLGEITCPVARKTKLAIAKGYYTAPLSQEKFRLRSGEALLKESRWVSNTLMTSAVEPKYEEWKVEVIQGDCLRVAEEELKQGAEKVAVLMFASPLEPGGAMAEGNQGQEEDLCRRSDIFGLMWDQAHPTKETTSLYYLVDLKGPDDLTPNYSLMERNGMVHVPDVTVFRAGKENDYTMLERPFRVGMLVSPGLNRPAYERRNGKTSYLRKEDEGQLRKLICTQLKTSYEENYDTVVLGAFGCGAFRNPPELIAEVYKQIIEESFKGAFKKVVFAILDDGRRDAHSPKGNLIPFQESFSSLRSN